MKIALLGDTALFGRCSFSGNSNIGDYFKHVSDYLDRFDYVVCNLETPFSAKKIAYGAKSAYICSDQENVEILKMLHVDAVTLANNHIYDYGDEGCELTKRLLESNKIRYFGVDGQDLKIELHGNKIAFTGFCCYSSNPLRAVPYGQKGVNEFDFKNAEEILVKNVKNGYFNILAIHSGIEHVNYPSLDTIDVARLFSKIAPYVYYGHHPHVAQGIEQYNDSLLAYSLGNFCFDDVYTSISKAPLVEISENNRSSFILEIILVNNSIKSYKTTPIYIGEDCIFVGRGVTEEILKQYSSVLSELSTNEYESLRQKYLDEYYDKRKNQRNLVWFLKRFKLRYFQLYLSNRQNAKRYLQCVKRYL